MEEEEERSAAGIAGAFFCEFVDKNFYIMVLIPFSISPRLKFNEWTQSFSFGYRLNASPPLHNRSTEREKEKEKKRSRIVFDENVFFVDSKRSEPNVRGTHSLPSGTRRAHHHHHHHHHRSKSLQSDTMCLPKKVSSAFTFDDASPPSGEWEGHMVDFIVDPETKLLNATKLPDYIVPQAYDDWEVFVYDWQTQMRDES